MSKVLTIERSKWLRGDKFTSKLLDHDGRMCCLGFDAIACGVAADEILSLSEPCQIYQISAPRSYLDSPRFLEGDGCFVQSDVIGTAIGHNDAKDITDAEREVLIRGDLKALGWDDVVFVD